MNGLDRCNVCQKSLFARTLHYKMVHCLSHVSELCIHDEPEVYLEQPLTLNDWKNFFNTDIYQSESISKEGTPGETKTCSFFGTHAEHEMCEGCSEPSRKKPQYFKRKQRLVYGGPNLKLDEVLALKEPSLVVPTAWIVSLFDDQEGDEDDEEEESIVDWSDHL